MSDDLYEGLAERYDRFHGAFGKHDPDTDVSASMLTQAEANLTQAGLTVPLHCVGYRELLQQIEGEFDAVVCLYRGADSLP